MTPLVRQPFHTTRLQEERDKDKGIVISLRLNEKELEELEADKELMNIGPDSAAIKLLVGIGRNVIRGQLGESSVKYLVSRRRSEYEPRD